MCLMDIEERKIIRALAAGDHTKRARAVEIYRQFIPALGPRGTPEMRYMSEVDTLHPDYTMRKVYAEELHVIEAAEHKVTRDAIVERA